MQTASERIMHNAYRNTSPSRTVCRASQRDLRPQTSLVMSLFTDNLTARMKWLDMDLEKVTAELNRRGINVGYSTVAGWLNGNRGTRWDVKQLQGLLDRSEEHTLNSSHMSISYAVFCLKKKNCVN